MAEVATAIKAPDWIDVVTKLIQMTQEGRLRWSPIPTTGASDQISSDHEVIRALQASYKGHHLQLLRVRVPAAPSLLPLVKAPPENRWVQETVLRLVDADGTTLWVVPKISALRDLMSTAEFQVADIRGFMEDILRER